MERAQRIAAGGAFAVGVAAGIGAAVAPFLPNGLLITGSACGGGGSAQRCIGLARGLSLLEVSPQAWFFVAAGAAAALLGAGGVLAALRGSVGSAALGIVVAALAVALLVVVEQIGASIDPSSAAGTTSRSDWGGFLTPELEDMREDAVREYGGRRTAPGGPVFDQILESFSVREKTGWRLLGASAVVGLFAALFALAASLVRAPPLMLTLAGTTGLVVWALAYDAAFTCDPGASECYRGILTMFAVAAAVLWWLAYAVAAGVAAGTRRRR